MNNVSLTGRLANHPEIAYTPTGTPVVKFRLAVNNRVGVRERADFFTIKTFGPRGEAVANYMTTGRLVAITGSLRQETWTTKDTGENRQHVIVVARSVEFLPDGRAHATSPTAPEDVVPDTGEVLGDAGVPVDEPF